MADVLAHPISPVPWAFANGDGTLCRTSKAALTKELEKNVASVEVIPSPSATVFDRMNAIQKLKECDKTSQLVM